MIILSLFLDIPVCAGKCYKHFATMRKSKLNSVSAYREYTAKEHMDKQKRFQKDSKVSSLSDWVIGAATGKKGKKWV